MQGVILAKDQPLILISVNRKLQTLYKLYNIYFVLYLVFTV